MTSASGAVHALLYSILVQHGSYEALVYWLPRSEWSTAPQNSGYAAAVFSTVAAHNSALILSSIDSPIAVRS